MANQVFSREILKKINYKNYQIIRTGRNVTCHYRYMSKLLRSNAKW